MRLFRTDRRFEEAARAPDGIDKLVKDLQRSRSVCLLLSLGLIVAFCAYALVGAYLAHRRLYGPPQKAEASLWFSVDALQIFGGTIAGAVIMGLVQMMSLDSQIKVLLFLRGQKGNPDGGERGVTTEV